MGTASLGSLVVSLALDSATFTSGLSKAEYEAQKSLKNISSSLESLKKGFESVAAAFGVGFGVSEIKDWAAGILEGAEKLHNLSIETGSSIEQLSKLQNAVEISGGSFDEFKSRLDKFSGTLTGVDAQSQKVASAMQLLGVPITGDPAKDLTATAEALNRYADGANKAALARALFGRDGVSFLASLKAIADGADISATKTKEQIDAAVKLTEAWRTLVVETHGLRDAFLETLVPALVEAIKRFKEAKELSGGGFIDFARAIVGIGKDPVEHLKELNDQLREQKALVQDISKGDITGRRITAGFPSLEEAQNAQRAIEQRIQIADAARVRGLGGPPTLDRGDPLQQAPSLPDAKALKAALDAQLVALKAASEQEKAQLDLANERTTAEYDQSLISLKEFGDRKEASLQQQLSNEATLYDQSRKLIENFSHTLGLSKLEQEGLQKELAQLTGRYIIGGIEGQKAFVKGANDQTKATKDFRDSISELNAQMEELKGNSGEATRIRDQFNKEKDKRSALVLSGDTTAVSNFDSIKAQAEAVASLSDARTKYGLVIDQESVAEQRLQLLASTGLTSEVEMFAKRADLAKQYIPLIEHEIELEKARLEALDHNSIAYKQGLIDIDRQKLAIDQLKQSQDGLKNSIDTTVTNDAVSFLDSVEFRTKSVSQAFRDMAGDISKTIAHLANEQIVKQLYKALFGDAGATGGFSLGGLISSLLSGGGAPGGSQFVEGSPNFVGPIAAAASGTDYARGGLTLVGEGGPELVNLPRGARVLPNNVTRMIMRGDGGGNSTIIQNINVMPGATRQTAAQAGSEVTRALRQAGRNR